MWYLLAIIYVIGFALIVWWGYVKTNRTHILERDQDEYVIIWVMAIVWPLVLMALAIAVPFLSLHLLLRGL